MTQPMKIQLALQGGGAKLCGLLAALDAVQRLEREGVLQVTRIAGTSAGAIAAALYAAGVELDPLRQRIVDNARTLLRIVPRPGFWSLVRAARGHPMVDLDPIRRALADVLAKKNAVRFGDLRIPLVVMVTDLTNGNGRPFDGREDNVVNTVLDSCALPFYFRGPGSENGAPLLVDGGICENFPVDVLRQYEETDGPVVGVTFGPGAVGKTPTTVLQFALALLETAMNNSVRRAQRQLPPERLLTLRGDIGTLDFPRALSEGMKDRYDLTRREAEDFFRALVHGLKPRPPRPTVVVESADSMDSVVTLHAHGEIYAAQHAHVRLRYHEIRMLLRARGLAAMGDAPADPDTLSYRFRFEAGRDPVECLRVALLPEQVTDFLQTVRTEVLDRNYATRRTIELLARDRDKPERRAYLHFLAPAIAPNDRDGPFTLQYAHQVRGLYNDLIEKGTDTFSIETMRAETVTPRVTIAAVVPRTRAGYVMRPSASTTSADKGRPMTPEEVRQLAAEIELEPDQYLLGWVGTNIEPGVEFAVDVHAPDS